MKIKIGFFFCLLLLSAQVSLGQTFSHSDVNKSEIEEKKEKWVPKLVKASGGGVTAYKAHNLYHISNTHPDEIKDSLTKRLQLEALDKKFLDRTASNVVKVLKKVQFKALTLAVCIGNLFYAVSNFFEFSLTSSIILVVLVGFFVYLIVIYLFKKDILKDQNIKTKN